MEIGDRIKSLRIQQNMTQAELAKFANTTMQTIYKYEKNIVTNIPYDRFLLIANALKTTPAHLMGWDVPKSEECTMLPVIGSVAAGVPIEESQDIEGYVEVAGDISDTYALRVHGDSMDPEIHDGDSVIIKKKNSYKNGDIVVARVNGYEYTVKRYHRDKSNIMLIPINRDFVPMVYDENTIAIEGKVIEVRRQYV